MPLDAMLSESAQLALAEVGRRRTPIAIWGPAANVGLVARNRFTDEHQRSETVPNRLTKTFVTATTQQRLRW